MVSGFLAVYIGVLMRVSRGYIKVYRVSDKEANGLYKDLKAQGPKIVKNSKPPEPQINET